MSQLPPTAEQPAQPTAASALLTPHAPLGRARDLLLVFLAAALLFCVIHATGDRVRAATQGLGALAAQAGALAGFSPESHPNLSQQNWDALFPKFETHVLKPARKVALLLSSGLLLGFIIGALRREPTLDGPTLRRAALTALAVLATISFLVFPHPLSSMGFGYGFMSLDPYGPNPALFTRRLLMPAWADALGLQGVLFYLLFSWALTWALVTALIVWLRRERIHLGPLGLVSLCTASFVFFSLQMPGYPDHLVFLLLLLSFLATTSAPARLACIALAIAAHEAALLPAALLAVFVLRGPERRLWIALTVLYVALLFGFSRLTGASPADANLAANEQAPWAYVLDHPERFVVGLAVAWKLLWLLPALAFLGALRHRSWREGLAVCGLTAGILPLLLVATDTSRLVAFTLPGILLALVLLFRDRPPSRPFQILFALNLLIPSFYCAVNGEWTSAPGLYRLLLPT